MASLKVLRSDGTEERTLKITYSPHLLEDVLKEGQVLSFRTNEWNSPAERNAMFVVGEAIVAINSYGRFSDESCGYWVTIESPNIHDFYAALRVALEHLEVPFEVRVPPCSFRHPSEQSFIRGVGNDFRALGAWIAGHWSAFKKRFGLRLMR